MRQTMRIALNYAQAIIILYYIIIQYIQYNPQVKKKKVL